MKSVLSALYLFSFFVTFAQPRSYSTANAHSHNDYVNATPFYLAFKNGFGSIEADIYLVNDTLMVAHSRQEIQQGKTLRSLYIQPLLRAMDSGSTNRLILLVDIKDNYQFTLPKLVNELQSLRKYLSDQHAPNRITIVISGNRPSPSGYKDFPGFIFFDDDMRLTHSSEEWKRVGLVSLSMTRITRWDGKDRLVAQDSMKLKKIIDSVHTAGRKIRFWAAPDNELSWQTQMNMGVDLIGTDKITELADFFRRKKTK